jgi:hypothetical protein
MSEKSKPIAVTAAEVPARTKPSVYPEPFASRMVGREKRSLGDLFGLTNFGVNLTRLAPNTVSALRHAHSKTSLFISSKVSQHCTPTKVEPGSLPECAQVSRQAQAMDTAWSMKPQKRLCTSKSATEHRETKEVIPMTTSKPCSLRESGSSSTETARPMCQVGAKHLMKANPVLGGRAASTALW